MVVPARKRARQIVVETLRLDVGRCCVRRADGWLEGNGYRVRWAIGHRVALAEPAAMRPEWKRWSRETLPMLPAEWPLTVLDKTKAQFEW